MSFREGGGNFNSVPFPYDDSLGLGCVSEGFRPRTGSVGPLDNSKVGPNNMMRGFGRRQDFDNCDTDEFGPSRFDDTEGLSNNMGGMKNFDQQCDRMNNYDHQFGRMNDFDQQFGRMNNFVRPVGRMRALNEYDSYFTKRRPFIDLFDDDEPREKKKKKRKKKAKIEEDEEGEVYCEVCDLTMASRLAYKAHAVSDDHIKLLEKQLMVEYYTNCGGEHLGNEESQNTNTGTWASDEKKCVVCEIDFDSYDEYEVHAAGTYHKLKVRQAAGEEVSAMCLVDKAKKPWGKAEELQEEEDAEKGEFFCKICTVDCTCAVNYQAHLRGTKHKKKMQKQVMTDDEYQNAIEDSTGLQAGYRPLLDTSENPLIGVEYIYHYKGLDEANFEFSCMLCDSPLSFANLLTHLTGWKHRRKYIKYHKPERYLSVLLETNTSKTTATEAAAEVAAEIESEIGRQKPRLRVFIPASEARLIMEHEHDRNIVNYRQHYWEEIHDGRPPPRSREELDADFEHWKRKSGFQLPYERSNCIEPDEMLDFEEMQARNRFGRWNGGFSGNFGRGRGYQNNSSQRFQPTASLGMGSGAISYRGDCGTGQFLGRRGDGPQPLMNDRMGEPRPLMGKPRPLMDEPRPHMDEPRPHMGEPRPHMGEPRPLTGEPRPLMGESRTRMGEPRPRMGVPRPCLGEPRPLMGEPRPLMGEPRPLMGELMPLIGGRGNDSFNTLRQLDELTVNTRGFTRNQGQSFNDGGAYFNKDPFYRPDPSYYELHRSRGRFCNPAMMSVDKFD